VSREAVAPLVEEALRGVPGAFDELVVRFQDMAVGTAYGWLRDLGLAEDAAQEAFVEVHANLDRLEDPAAFPGFLRRVVLKHCDRRTRGVRRERTVAEADPGAAPGPPADASLVLAEDRARVRAAVEALPAGERLAVALHYLAGLSQAEVARWLELPLSTVKKRLHSARGRLRDVLEDPMSPSLEALRPSRDSRFSDTLKLFLAVREGDAVRVRALLERSPELAEAEERWDDELTRAHALPVPNGGTPLVRAAQRDRVEIVDLLLDCGADVDRACPCAGSESPLWAAVASGARAAARRLLERGADPDRASFADHTPLHVAALRGYDDIVELLCEYGADGTRRDSRGRTPADWALRKGRVALAGRLAERFGPAGGERSSPRVRVRPAPPFETGLKALDLLAPIFPGSLCRTRFDPGMGAVVFLAELSARWQRRAGGEAPAVVWVGWERQSVDRSEMEHAFAELDLEGRATLVWSPARDDEDERRRTLERAAREARAMQERGVAHPLVVAFAQHGRLAEVESGLPELVDGAGGRLTAIVAERGGEPAGDGGPLCQPYDVRLSFDPALAAIGHFPALHPLHSRSAALVPERVGAEHCALVARVRSLFARQRERVPDLGDGDGAALSPEDRLSVLRARRLQAWLTQPFEVAESFTGEPGRAPGVADTLADVAAILDGALDDVHPGRVVYKGRLSEVFAGDSAVQTVR